MRRRAAAAVSALAVTRILISEFDARKAKEGFTDEVYRSSRISATSDSGRPQVRMRRLAITCSSPEAEARQPRENLGEHEVLHLGGDAGDTEDQLALVLEEAGARRPARIGEHLRPSG